MSWQILIFYKKNHVLINYIQVYDYDIDIESRRGPNKAKYMDNGGIKNFKEILLAYQ